MRVTKFEAPFAYHGLDRVFHEKARLGIVSSLIGHADGLAFSDLGCSDEDRKVCQLGYGT